MVIINPPLILLFILSPFLEVVTLVTELGAPAPITLLFPTVRNLTNDKFLFAHFSANLRRLLAAAKFVATNYP
jgi:hypothetical protein